MAFIILRYISSMPIFLRLFYHNWMLNFIKSIFSIYWDDHVALFSSFLMWCIILIDLWILNYPCNYPCIYPWNKSHLIWCMILLYILEFCLPIFCLGLLYLYSSEIWIRKIPWRRKWQLTSVFMPGKSHGLRSLVSYSPTSVRHNSVTKQQQFIENIAL